MSREDIVYMAGLMDGEGTIGLGRTHADRIWRTPYISVASTTPELMDWLKSTFGGYVSGKKTYQEHHKSSWSWSLYNKDKLFALLAELAPLLKEPNKRARAELLLSTYDKVTPRNGKYTDEMWIQKNDFEMNFRAIK